ncbi:E3 ubiquitin-protein ligase CHFR [Denticeps clupeoides]|uniref:E3 ubiquitin-protein ligase CHFR n=1 Tax=Denticeps clupeoides TaxID=299321 RepID=A0AAY4C2C6_9TELE|nr:E3 ubiquitin-protein ligase CHFR [Denticeps clupeoides]
MERPAGAEPWGKLVKVDSGSGAEVLLVNRECTVGRRKGCDLSFPCNKLVSGDHCRIVQDELSGEVWLEDMSTNGTVINMSKLVKKQKHFLQNGDVIYFVYRKNEPEQNIAYVFQSMKPLHAISQKACTVHPKLDSKVRNKGKQFAPQEPVLEEPQPSTSSSHCYSTSFLTSAPGSAVEPVIRPLSLREMLQSEEGSKVALKEGEELEPPDRKRRKIVPASDEFDCSHSKSSDGASVPKQLGVIELVRKDKGENIKTDKMEESLTCIICQDLLYDCVSLQPCMHTFCAACYSGWMERSSLCPTCRCPVERIRKNHILNNLVEAYLQQHPEKCRSEEDLKSMDSRNKITQDMLQPKIERSFSDEEGSSDYLFDLSDNDSDTSDISQSYLTCRQCPGYRKDMSQALWISNPHPDEGVAKPLGEGPSTSSSDATSVPTLREFQCPPHGSHIICTCCLQPMPDRRSELTGQQLSSQQCMVCQRPFCHLYWGCQRLGCQGCLARFSELNLSDKCLDAVLNSNNYESEVLQNYLSSRGRSWREMLLEGLQAVQQGVYHLSDYRINASAVLCYCCGLRVFKELAYKYRENIPTSELPASVTSRPDCYWGRNCRTQVKAHHAMKFNHICEQTRFKN